MSATPLNAAGKIFLVGLGPGSEAHMTARARQAIDAADVVIGYTTYIKLVADLLHGKQIVRKGMTEELDRCHEALAAAREGKTVALISSGDSGVYGMAGPTYEVLFQSGWQPGDGVTVEVVPGSSAINACAALVGAPLTHDFCSISLSDLLTPWPVIAGRLDAAARGDFVVALYNPKSGRRTGQILEAQRIMLLYRAPQTPVALVKSAYRRRQTIEMTTLSQMAESDIGMLTTVLIGNSNTFVKHGLMVTPRGYANKYAGRDELREGELAGRSLSMGLTGWHAQVRRYLAATPGATLRQAAEHFSMPQGEVLAAIHVSAGSVLPYQSTQVHASAINKVLQFIQSWGPVRAVIRSDAGAITELLLDGSHLANAFTAAKPGWLNVITPYVHLHVNWNNVKSAWLVGREGKLHGAYFLDARGNVVVAWLLRREGESPTLAMAFDPEALNEWFPLATAPQPIETAEVINVE